MNELYPVARYIVSTAFPSVSVVISFKHTDLVRNILWIDLFISGAGNFEAQIDFISLLLL